MKIKNDIEVELLPPSEKVEMTKEAAEQEIFKLLAIFVKIKQRVSD